jgi:hypothetical protein
MHTLTNSFHRTEFGTSKAEAEIEAIRNKAPWDRTEAERRWVRKVWKTLCGIAGCTCGNDLGER